MRHLFEPRTKNTFIKRADPRLVIIVGIVLIIMIVSSKTALFPSIVGCLSLALALYMKVSIKSWLMRFSEPVFIAVVLVTIKFFYTGVVPMTSFNLLGIEFTGNYDGLMDGLLIAIRMLCAVSVVSVLSFAISFTDFVSALAWMKIPRGFVDVLVFTFRYIFLLFDEATVIYDAQRNRLGYTNVRRALSSFGTLAGSLTIKAFESSHNIAVAMKQRGYDGNLPQTQRASLKPKDIALTALIIFIAGVAWKI